MPPDYPGYPKGKRYPEFREISAPHNAPHTPPPPPPHPREKPPSVDDARRDWRLNGLESDLREVRDGIKALDIRLDQLEGTVTLGFANSRAQGHSETTKVIITGVVSIVTALAGAIGVMELRRSNPPPTVIHRTEFDKKLDVCRDIPNGTEAWACIQKAAADIVAKP